MGRISDEPSSRLHRIGKTEDPSRAKEREPGDREGTIQKRFFNTQIYFYPEPIHWENKGIQQIG